MGINKRCRYRCALAMLAMVSSAYGSDWLTFSEESTTRIQAASHLVLQDIEEKDYAWGDLDGDGDEDLVIVRKQPFSTAGGRRNVLLMNENGVLVDRTNEFATAANDGGQGFLDATNDRDVIIADLDNDGFPEVITAVSISPGQPKTIGYPRIYKNLGVDGNGNWLGLFYDEPRIPAMLTKNGFSGVNPRFMAVAAGDVTGDGYADLYFGDMDSGGWGSIIPENLTTEDFDNKLLINLGDQNPGFFVDETNMRLTAVMKNAAYSAAVAIADMNNDGHLDLVKQTALQTPQRIEIAYNKFEEGGGVFEQNQNVTNNAPYYVTAADLNNDGWNDLIVQDDFNDFFKLNTQQVNQTTGVASFGPNTNLPGTNGFGGMVLVEDFDNDGWKDIFVADVSDEIGPCLTGRVADLLRNNANPPNVTFTNDQANLATDKLMGVYHVASPDIDKDGFKDLIVGRCGTTEVYMNIIPYSINFSYPAGLPTFVTPNLPVTIQVVMEGVLGTIVPGTEQMFVSVNGGAYVPQQLIEVSGGVYRGTLPAAECGSTVDYYFSGIVEGNVITDPPNAPTTTYTSTALQLADIVFADDMEGDVSDYVVTNDASLTSGAWQPAVPTGTSSGTVPVAPDSDNTPNGTIAWVTQNGAPGGAAGASDVDNGCTSLTTPVLDSNSDDAIVSFAYWFMWVAGGGPDTTPDTITISVSNDNGGLFVSVAELGNTNSAWQNFSFRVSDFVTPTNQVRVRFTACDLGLGSLVEAGIDDIEVQRLDCEGFNTVNASTITDGSIDARQPSNVDGSGVTGFDAIDLGFTNEVASLTVGDFSITQEGGDVSAPTLVDLQVIGPKTVRLAFSGPVTPEAWTTISFIPTNAEIRFGYLPGDVNGDGVTTVSDVLALVDALNGVSMLPIESTDIDRSGASNASDVLRQIDLLNGAGAFKAYNGVSLP